MQPIDYSGNMTVLDQLKQSIHEVGIKEMARRAGLAASTVSRVNSGQIKPVLKSLKRSLRRPGFVEFASRSKRLSFFQVDFCKRILSEIKEELKKNGVRHAFIFGSVAREEDRPESDIDII